MNLGDDKSAWEEIMLQERDDQQEDIVFVIISLFLYSMPDSVLVLKDKKDMI